MKKEISHPFLISVISLMIISCLTVAFYWQTTRFEFVLDDVMVIKENSFVQKGFKGIREILTNDSMTGHLGKQPQLLEGGRYRPLSLVIFATGYQFFKLNPFWYHLMNVFFYLITGLLLYNLLRQIFRNGKSGYLEWSVAMAVLIFMVHPVHTEVVCNVKGADEILAMIFGLSGWIAMLKWADRPSFRMLLIAWLSLLLAFLSKESSLPLVVTIPLSLFFFRDFSVRQTLRAFLLLIVPVVLYFIMRYQALGYLLSGDVYTTGIMNNPYFHSGFTAKYCTILYTLLLYLKLLIVPYPQTHDYYPWQIPLQSVTSVWVWLAVIVLVLLVYLAVKGWRKREPWSYAILFFLITLSIVSNVLINVGTLLNERFLFIPSVSVAILIIWVLRLSYPLKVHKTGFVTISLLFLVAIAYSWLTIKRIPVWENTMTLNRAGVKVSKNSARANLFYGVALFNEMMKQKDDSVKLSMIREARKYNDRALEIYPEYADALRMKAGHAAEAWKIDKDLPVLLSEFEKAMADKPVAFVEEFVNWLLPRADRGLLIPFLYRVGYDNLAVKQKNFPEALKYLKKAYQLDPQDPKILFGLCVISNLAGKHQDAVSSGEQFLAKQGNNAEILFYTGKSMLQLNQKDKGNQYLNEAYRLKPELKNR